MRRALAFTLALSLSLAAGAVGAEAAEQSAGEHAALLGRFQAFDQAAADGWTAQEPLFSQAATGKPTAAPLSLTPGAYMVVVLCGCASMDVTVVAPGGATVAPARSSDQGAMYSLDVPAAGDYLVGIDMNDCEAASCDVAVKVYRKGK